MFFFLWRVMQRKPSLGKPDQKDLNENLAATQGLAHMIAECKKLFQVKHLCKTNGCSIGRYGLGLPYNGKLQMSLYFNKDQYVMNNLLKKLYILVWVHAWIWRSTRRIVLLTWVLNRHKTVVGSRAFFLHEGFIWTMSSRSYCVAMRICELQL